VLPAMMTSLAFPDLRLFSVDLYPRVTLERVLASDLASRVQEDSLSTLHHKRQARVDGVGRLLSFLGGHRCASGSPNLIGVPGIIDALRSIRSAGTVVA